jgi:lysophospholipid acyltransferase (LPLAT)-like uncharacterized protein
VRILLLALGRLWLRSLRVRWIGTETALPDRAVIVLWHEHLPALIRIFSGRGIHVLISRSADGDWAARACESFGYRVHRGSSTRGGAQGMRTLIRGMETGGGLAGMALDGPRGPRRIPKPGSRWLARQRAAAVVPVWVEARRAFRLKTWDRSLIPWPFSKVTVRVGKPFHPRGEDQIAEAMRNLESQAEWP